MDKCRKCMHEGKDIKCKKCRNFVPFGDHFEQDVEFEGSESDIY